MELYDKKILQKPPVILINHQDPNGRLLWSLVSIKLDKIDQLTKMLQGYELFDISDYGKILLSGKGKAPFKVIKTLSQF